MDHMIKDAFMQSFKLIPYKALNKILYFHQSVPKI